MDEERRFGQDRRSGAADYFTRIEKRMAEIDAETKRALTIAQEARVNAEIAGGRAHQIKTDLMDAADRRRTERNRDLKDLEERVNRSIKEVKDIEIKDLKDTERRHHVLLFGDSEEEDGGLKKVVSQLKTLVGWGLLVMTILAGEKGAELLGLLGKVAK